METTNLEHLKEVEKKANEKLLLESLKRIKELSKKVLRSKEEVKALLERLGISDKEQKSIIDWVNSLPSVQLTEEDKREIREISKKEIAKEEKKIREEKDFYNYVYGISQNAVTLDGTMPLTVTTGVCNGATISASSLEKK